MDVVDKTTRSDIMSRVKSKDSKIEQIVRRTLWKNGFRYRKNSSGYVGKPDIVLVSLKTVVFVDSCFWHGCKKHCRMPASNKTYWTAKIARNKKRDKIVNAHYKKMGWTALRIWEHDIPHNVSGLLEKLNFIKREMSQNE